MGVSENKAMLERFDRLAAQVPTRTRSTRSARRTWSTMPSPRTGPRGSRGTKEFLRECQLDPGRAAWMRSMITDQQVVTIGEGDYVIQYGTRNGTWSGGRFRGIDIGAGAYQYEVAFMYRFESGRIAERRALRDDLAMIQQLNGSRKHSQSLPTTTTRPSAQAPRRGQVIEETLTE